MTEPRMLNRKLALVGDVEPSELRIAVLTVMGASLIYIRSSLREGDLLSAAIVMLAALGTLLALGFKTLIASGE